MPSPSAPVLLAAALLACAAPAVPPTDPLAEPLAEIKTASQELIRLHGTVKDEESARAASARIEALQRRRDAAEVAVAQAMGRLEPGNARHAAALERVFAEIQAVRHAESEAQLAALEAVAKARSSAGTPPPHDPETSRSVEKGVQP